MFTGIIEEIAQIEKTKPIAGGLSIKIGANKILEDISVNDSICIDGVCLTVTNFDNSGFWVDAVGATLEKSTFASV
ncbi:MAG: riboflavin synthase, partial [Ignavibacteriaceae bacterium]|nr:riboflavin synthase [Ignavibacteriaceae bacterium]